MRNVLREAVPPSCEGPEVTGNPGLLPFRMLCDSGAFDNLFKQPPWTLAVQGIRQLDKKKVRLGFRLQARIGAFLCVPRVLCQGGKYQLRLMKL